VRAKEQTVVSTARSSAWMRLARAGWYAALAISLAILIAVLPGAPHVEVLGVFGANLVYTPSPAMVLARHLLVGIGLLASLLSIGLAGLLFARRSTDPMGLFLSYFLLAHGIVMVGTFELLEPIWPLAPWVNTFLLLPLYLGPVLMAFIGLFPDGRFIPRWSRWLVLAAAMVLPFELLAGRQSLQGGVVLEHPLVMQVLWALVILAGVWAQLYRYRYVSDVIQRQQTKWVLYGVALWLACMLATSVFWIQALNLPRGTLMPWWLPGLGLLWTISTLFLPLSLTLAILRYRLWDIDILIRRTLVYSTLSGTLVLVYYACVLLLQPFFSAVTGQAQSEAITVLSTLVVAGLFFPLRQRLQAAVDRRFYRQKYNAARTLAEFSASTRDQTDLEQLASQLAGVVEETMQPAHLSLWLRPSAPRGGTPLALPPETNQPAAPTLARR
jgi:hypothetical protein